jgi:hypothetical protein
MGTNASANRTLTVTGHYTQGTGATLRVHVTDLGGGNYTWGVIDVTGTAELAGAIDFVAPVGLPQNSTGTVLKSGTRNGTLTPPRGAPGPSTRPATT